MYKRIFVGLAFMLLVIGLVGCNTNESGSEGKNSSTTKLNMLFWDSNQEVGLKAMAEGFMKENPDYKVIVETVPWDQYWTKLQAATQGGDMPDIVVMHPDEVDNYAEGGKLMDLTSMFDSSTITSLDKFPDYIVEDFTIDDKVYGVPKDVGNMGLVYNKDLFDAAGVNYPDDSWTWEDMFSAAEKITDKSKKIYGIAAPNNGQNFYWNLIWQNDGDFFTDDGVSTFDLPENIEAVEYAVSFIEKGYSPTISDFAGLSVDEHFEAGKVGMVFAGSWMLTEYLDVDGLNFDVAPLPKGKERAAISSGMAFSVSESSKNPEAALKLVEYLGSEEAQLIQSESGVAISAYQDTQAPWVEGFDSIDVSPFVGVTEYGHSSPGLTTNNEASAVIDKYMPEIFSLKIPVAEGMKKIREEVNALK